MAASFSSAALVTLTGYGWEGKRTGIVTLATSEPCVQTTGLPDREALLNGSCRHMQVFVGNPADRWFPGSLVERMGKGRGRARGPPWIEVMQAPSMMTWRRNRITWAKQEA